MATIGTLAEKDGKLIGKIQTLSINASLTFLPNQNRSSPDAPAYRAFRGRTEVGAAWEKTSDNTRRTYYSVRFDDPTFTAPFFANLVAQDEGGFALIWSRPQRRD
ncbi:MAG TPA: DUF736 domain-containing protein [Acetobacteraceae bacterium]|nr:DUF736 domain-containing protein [Acetobacteraceae bacterium]